METGFLATPLSSTIEIMQEKRSNIAVFASAKIVLRYPVLPIQLSKNRPCIIHPLTYFVNTFFRLSLRLLRQKLKLSFFTKYEQEFSKSSSRSARESYRGSKFFNLRTSLREMSRSFCLHNLIETEYNTRVHDECADDQRPVVEEDSFNEQETLYDKDRRGEKQGKVGGAVTVMHHPALAIISGRDHCPRDNERHAPNSLRVPKRRVVLQLAV